MGSTKNKKNVLQVKTIKQKVLLPTLKEHQRYVVYRIMVKDLPNAFNNANFSAIHNDIVSKCNGMLGIFDGGRAGLIGTKYNAEKMIGIIRVNNKYVDKLKVCLGLINEVGGHKANVECIYVSGMLNKAVDRMI